MNTKILYLTICNLVLSYNLLHANHNELLSKLSLANNPKRLIIATNIVNQMALLAWLEGKQPLYDKKDIALLEKACACIESQDGESDACKECEASALNNQKYQAYANQQT